MLLLLFNIPTDLPPAQKFTWSSASNFLKHCVFWIIASQILIFSNSPKQLWTGFCLPFYSKFPFATFRRSNFEYRIRNPKHPWQKGLLHMASISDDCVLFWIIAKIISSNKFKSSPTAEQKRTSCVAVEIDLAHFGQTEAPWSIVLAWAVVRIACPWLAIEAPEGGENAQKSDLLFLACARCWILSVIFLTAHCSLEILGISQNRWEECTSAELLKTIDRTLAVATFSVCHSFEGGGNPGQENWAAKLLVLQIVSSGRVAVVELQSGWLLNWNMVADWFERFWILSII